MMELVGLTTGILGAASIAALVSLVSAIVGITQVVQRQRRSVQRDRILKQRVRGFVTLDEALEELYKDSPQLINAVKSVEVTILDQEGHRVNLRATGRAPSVSEAIVEEIPTPYQLYT